MATANVWQALAKHVRTLPPFFFLLILTKIKTFHVHHSFVIGNFQPNVYTLCDFDFSNPKIEHRDLSYLVNLQVPQI